MVDLTVKDLPSYALYKEAICFLHHGTLRSRKFPSAQGDRQLAVQARHLANLCGLFREVGREVLGTDRSDGFTNYILGLLL